MKNTIGELVIGVNYRKKIKKKFITVLQYISNDYFVEAEVNVKHISAILSPDKTSDKIQNRDFFQIILSNGHIFYKKEI